MRQRPSGRSTSGSCSVRKGTSSRAMKRACGAWLAYSTSRLPGGTNAATSGATSPRWIRLSSTVLAGGVVEVVVAVVDDEQRVARPPRGTGRAGRAGTTVRAEAPCCATRPTRSSPGGPRGRVGTTTARRSPRRPRPSCAPNGPWASLGLSGSLTYSSRCSPRTISNWYSTREPSGSSMVTHHRSVPGIRRNGSGSGSPTTRWRTMTSSASPRQRNVANRPSMTGRGVPRRGTGRPPAPSTASRSRSRLMASLRVCPLVGAVVTGRSCGHRRADAAVRRR